MGGVLLKLLHGCFELLQRAGQQTGQHPARRQRGQKNKPRRDNRDAHHLPEALIDGFVNVADADDAPCAARHTLYAVDDRVLHVGAVAEAGQTPGLLLL